MIAFLAETVNLESILVQAVVQIFAMFGALVGAILVLWSRILKPYADQLSASNAKLAEAVVAINVRLEHIEERLREEREVGRQLGAGPS